MVCIGYPCPDCGEYGGLYAVKNKKNGKLWVYCDECDTLWETPEDASNHNYIDAKEEFEWGGYATLEEVKNFGWEKYIKQ